MRTLLKFIALGVTGVLAACSVHGVTFTEPLVTVGGTITGLDGTGLVLTNNGVDDLTISGNGAFAFTTPLKHGASYAIALKSQPSSPVQMCSVGNGNGTAGDEDVTDVQVNCRTAAFNVGGTVTGLDGSGLVLQNNHGDDLPVNADGTFVFATSLLDGASYEVTVAMQPSQPAQGCTVTNGTGKLSGSDVMNVQVACVTRTFTIGGTVTGLLGAGLVVQDNAGDDLAISADGIFTFATPIASGSAFAVTVRTQPAVPSQTCTVAGGTGLVGAGDVTSVVINCTTNRYTIGGTISGLAGTVTLQNNGGDDLAITSNGTFAFPTPVLSGATYAVTVKTQPTTPSQTCTVTAGSGMVTNADVTNVVVTCTTNRFSVGGTLSGLAAGDSITLRNNGGDDLVLGANGSFRFPTQVASGQPYAVTLVANPTSPISQTCTVTNGVGFVAGSDITNVQVICTTNKFTIGGTVSGLTGTGLVLQDNGGDNLSIAGNGTFTFATPVASGATYSVTVKTRPSGQTCTVTRGTGTVGASNVTNVQVTCSVATRMLVAINDSSKHLERIDPDTFAVTDVGPLGVNYAFGDCAFDTANATLYMVDGRGAQALYRVDIATGAATLIGVHGITDMFALAYDPPTNTLFGASVAGNLYRIDTGTGAATVVGATGRFEIDGLVFDSKRNVMVGLTAGSSTLFSINVSTGATQSLLSTSFINNLGLTYDPVIDRFWVADFDGNLLQFDPNNGFARSTVATIGGPRTCIAFIPATP